MKATKTCRIFVTCCWIYLVIGNFLLRSLNRLIEFFICANTSNGEKSCNTRVLSKVLPLTVACSISAIAMICLISAIYKSLFHCLWISSDSLSPFNTRLMNFIHENLELSINLFQSLQTSRLLARLLMSKKSNIFTVTWGKHVNCFSILVDKSVDFHTLLFQLQEGN